jgi:hypothetical protein
MANLYETLGVLRTASNLEIRTAVRALVRRYHEESARGERDPTAALYVVNQARLTFADPKRKHAYDRALAAGEKVPSGREARRASISADSPKTAQLTAPAPEQRVSESAAAGRPLTLREEYLSTPAAESLPPIFPSSHVAHSGHLPTAEGALPEAPFRLAANATLGSLLAPPTPAKQRSITPAPWLRLTARLVDYALWGLLLSIVLPVARAKELLTEAAIGLLDHPLVAPVLITLSWVPIEAALLAIFSVTPAKLLFDIHVTFNVTDPYASENPVSRLLAALIRAFRVWWSGLACAITPLYLFTMMSQRRMLQRVKETSWDFDGDCLVSHGKMVAAAPVLAAAVLGLAAWIGIAHWAVAARQVLNTGWQAALLGAETVTEAVEPLRPKVVIRPAPPPPPPTDPALPSMRQAKAAELAAAGDWRALAAHCKAWTQTEDRSASAWECLGRADYQLGNHAAAVTALKRATVLAPSNEAVRHLLLRSSDLDMQQKQLRRRPSTSPIAPNTAPPPEIEKDTVQDKGGEAQDKGADAQDKAEKARP